MLRRYFLICVGFAGLVSAQPYNGPRPASPDVPYIKHGSTLIATEQSVAKDETKKDTITHVIEGASSPVVTPLAAPVFLFQADKIAPDSLQLVKLESKNGRRAISETKRKPLKTIRTEVTRLTADKLWQIEADESLTPGEYAFSPDNSEKVFCFQVR
jgi:hypothetical protein